MSAEQLESLLAVDVRDISVHNGTVSISFPKDAMRQIGILDENDEPIGEPQAKVAIRDDETGHIDFQTDG